jgi:cobalt transporter subunit CbtA
MLRHLLTSALIAGLGAGLAATVLQIAFVVPLILEGELYESGTLLHFSATGSPQSPVTHPDIWAEPARHFGTFAMNLVTWSGFAFILVAAFGLAERTGANITAQSGAIWGLSGFVAVQLAPAMGLPPELPGAIGADIVTRQLWWTATVAASIGGLGLFAFGRGAGAVGAGAVLLLAPHVIGAPELDTYFGVAPAELSAHYAARSLAVGAAAWAILGTVAGAVWSRPA